MRLIDADAIQYTMLYKENWFKGTGVEAQGVWKSEIDKMPTVDAVPVVRCRDCKHHGEQNGSGYCMKDGCYGWDDGDYCSRAERAKE